MDAVLQQAIVPVLRDLRTAGVAMPTFTGDPLSNAALAAATLVGADGGGRSVYVVRTESLAEQVVMAADQVQEWVIEERWPRAPTNWPACPHHQSGHPMAAAEQGGRALWTCPVDRAALAMIGGL